MWACATGLRQRDNHEVRVVQVTGCVFRRQVYTAVAADLVPAEHALGGRPQQRCQLLPLVASAFQCNFLDSVPGSPNT